VRNVPWRFFLGALVVLGFWEGACHAGWISQIILPPPSGIFLAAVNDGSVFLKAFAVTLFEVTVSIVIAWTLGVVSGLIAGSAPVVSIAIGSVLSSLFAIPLVILYPVFMAWVGIGSSSKILFGVMSGYFPIALNTLNGMQAVETRYVTMARAMGASRLQLYARVLFPLAVPSIVSGLRIGTGLIVIGVIVAEMLASRDGIGFLITYHRTLFDTSDVYLGFIFAISMAIGINLGLSALERRFSQFSAPANDA
jgi:NitT/TauT family transport system permease protein/taurine transport system permease protein